MKIKEKKIKVFEEHGKKLVKYSDEKESLTFSKQKEIFEELANRRMENIQDLNNQIGFNNLTYHYKGKTAPKSFIVFNCPLRFYENIKKSYITLEQAEENLNLK